MADLQNEKFERIERIETVLNTVTELLARLGMK